MSYLLWALFVYLFIKTNINANGGQFASCLIILNLMRYFNLSLDFLLLKKLYLEYYLTVEVILRMMSMTGVHFS